MYDFSLYYSYMNNLILNSSLKREVISLLFIQITWFGHSSIKFQNHFCWTLEISIVFCKYCDVNAIKSVMIFVQILNFWYYFRPSHPCPHLCWIPGLVTVSSFLSSVLVMAWVHLDMQTCPLTMFPGFKNSQSPLLWRFFFSLFSLFFFSELHSHIP